MSAGKHQKRARLYWLFLGTLFALCGVLALLQYRWIGEVSVAARDRLHGSLQATLIRLSQDFNSQIAGDWNGLIPQNGSEDVAAIQAELVSRFEQWKRTTHHGALFQRVALAVPHKQTLELLILNQNDGSLAPSPWPAEWSDLKSRTEARLNPDNWNGPGQPRQMPADDDFTIEVPLFGAPQQRPPFPGFGRREAAWLMADLNSAYIRDVLLPETVQRYLGSGTALDYQVEVASKGTPGTPIYQSDAHQPPIAGRADASASLFEPQLMRNGGPGRGAGPGRGPAPADMGRWQISVRHRAGSLEAVVERARWQNLAIAAGVILLILATASALIRFTRRTQKLAETQMDFVAAVSHELRTPLAVIHTAAYNLQGKLAHNPAQIEKYGALIQGESGKLKELVEQILRFATAEAGRIVQEREPLSVETVIDEAVAASKPLLNGSQCVFEKNIARGLPLVLGDRSALRHAIQNLVANAIKYGLKDANWIGVSAATVNNGERQAVEVRVADRGPGIPREEQEHIFDPFFRGARAIEDQVHGTGLGLSLVRKIVEAHGGNIRVEDEPVKGTAFIMRLPAIPAGPAG